MVSMIDEVDEALFLTPEKFYEAVMVHVNKHTPYINSVMLVCDEKGIDPEDLTGLSLISPLLKSKLYVEGLADGELKSDSTLNL